MLKLTIIFLVKKISIIVRLLRKYKQFIFSPIQAYTLCNFILPIMLFCQLKLLNLQLDIEGWIFFHAPLRRLRIKNS